MALSARNLRVEIQLNPPRSDTNTGIDRDYSESITTFGPLTYVQICRRKVKSVPATQPFSVLSEEDYVIKFATWYSSDTATEESGSRRNTSGD
jgi:hypothetical protein